MRWIVLIFLLTFGPLAQANYRVFALRITHRVTKETRLVYSTLDWLQYHEYHYLKPEEIITMEDTWMCWRRNKRPYRPVCKRPVTEATLRADFQAQKPY